MPKIESGLLLLTLFSIILTLLVHSAFADRAGKPKPRSRLVPAPLLRWPENSSEYSIIVDKSAQKIAVYHRDNPYTPIKIYRCSTGENDGQKTRKNDRKTPEGIYFFTKSYIKKELSPRYGVRAFPIDYPNSIDKKEGRKGYGIWFHGLNKPLKPKDTNGCIALENNNIDQLSSYIKLNDTPIIISPKIEMVGPVKQKKERRELEKIIEGWRRAWERKEIDRYMSFYHDKFHSGRKNWQKWKAYKTRLAKKYKQIRVEIDNLQILRNNSVVLARFTQAYSTAGFNSSGEKRLYLQQNSKQWKIIGESFRASGIKRAAPEKSKLYSSKEIEKFIHRWEKAWEQKDLKTYISCYDPKFRSRGMDLKAWKKHRTKLNRKYCSLKIDISNLKLVQISDRTARVTFKQDYRADRYHDFGLKKMFLIKEGKHWKIRLEKWSPLRRRSRL